MVKDGYKTQLYFVLGFSIFILGIGFIFGGFFDALTAFSGTGHTVEGLSETGSINIVVRNQATGTQIRTATVVMANSGGSHTGVMNDQGFYQFLSIPAETYQVTVTASGYQTYTQQGFVINSGTNNGFGVNLISNANWALGIKARWALDESPIPINVDGVKDSAGTSPGTMRGGITSIAKGINGSAYHFDGVDDDIVVSAAKAPVLSGSFTLSGWFFSEALESEHNMSWFSKRNSYVFGAWPDGHVSFFIYSAGAWKEAKTLAGMAKENVWQHWSAVYTGNDLIIYLNGSEAGKSTYSGSVETGGDLYLGYDNVTGETFKRYFKGSMDEAAIYSSALSQAEVSALYSAQAAGMNRDIPTEISACGIIVSAGTYILTKDLSATDTCIQINADNVLLDGKGYAIKGSSALRDQVGKMGVSAYGRTNITLKNIRIEEFYHGIYFEQVKNSQLYELRATNNKLFGAFVNSSEGLLVNRSDFNSNSESGFSSRASKQLNFSDVSFSSNKAYGIVLTTNTNSVLLADPIFNANVIYSIYNDSSSKDWRIIITRTADPVILADVITADKLSAGYSRNMSPGERIVLMHADKAYNFTYLSPSSGKAAIRIGIQTYTLSLNEAKLFDLTGDKIDDLRVRFTKIDSISGKAAFTFDRPSTIKPTDTTDTKPKDATGTLPKEQTQGGTGNASNLSASGNAKDANSESFKKETILIIAVVMLIVFAIIIGIIWYLVMRKNRLSGLDENAFSIEPRSAVGRAPF